MCMGFDWSLMDQVVTNPHNPLGRTYPLETLIALARFAEEEDLQLIMNEIYSRSIYDNPGMLGPRIHRHNNGKQG